MGIPIGASGNSAEMPFALYSDSTGLPITGWVFSTGEVKVKLPGVAYANATIANVVEWGNGQYALQLTAGQTATAGSVGISVTVTGAGLWRSEDRIDAAVSVNTAAVATAVWQYVIENSKTAEQLMRGYASALLAKMSGANTSTRRFRNLADTKDRIVATTSVAGRDAITTLDLT